MKVVEKLYCVLDHVSGELREFTVATSDGLAVRRILMTLRVPIKDNTVFCLGEIERNFAEDCRHVDSSCISTRLDEFRQVSWSSYRFPEDKAEALAPLGLTPDELSEVR